MMKSPVEIAVSDLTIAYGDFVLLKNVSFEVNKGDVFIIMGASGGGKSSLLRVLTGLVPAAHGKIVIGGVNFTAADEQKRQQIMQKCGILYQSGALFSSMTLAENIALPLKQYTNYSDKMISELVSLKLALVGLSGFEEFYPSEVQAQSTHERQHNHCLDYGRLEQYFLNIFHFFHIFTKDLTAVIHKTLT